MTVFNRSVDSEQKEEKMAENEKEVEFKEDEKEQVNIEDLQKNIRSKTIEIDNLKRKLNVISNYVRSVEDEHKKQLDSLSVRKDEEMKKKEKFAVSNFSVDLMNVVENFASVISLINEDDYAQDDKLFNFIKGAKMTLGLFDDLLKKYGIEIINPDIGSAFDPNLHKAIKLEKDPEMPDNSVIEILRPGYRLGERILRHASVIVSGGDI
ncbi:nucleotide exchange factor GrpE [Anaplasmataceae bacterium AB001_6]|nr:nucleotide exchange factor GrpE [Anaplasmataceae bacterium AB001_6]